MRRGVPKRRAAAKFPDTAHSLGADSGMDDFRPKCLGARDAPHIRSGQGGAGRHLAPITQGDLARRYGYFIDHLMRNDLFEPGAWTAGQVTPNRVESFVEELRSRVGSVTMAQTIHKLRRAAQLLDPNRDFAWLAEIEKDFAMLMRPSSKDHRIVDPDRLYEAGLALIEEAIDNPALDATAPG